MSAHVSSIVFVEAPQTGAGLSHLRWALDHGHDAWFATSNAEKYRKVAGFSLLAELLGRGRLLTCASTEEPTPGAEVVERLRGLARPAGVVCVSDRHLAFAAGLAQHLEAPFASPQAIRTLRDKRAARRLFDELELPSVRWQDATSAESVSAFCASVGGPIVLKNAAGTGSLDVELAATPEAAASAFERLRATPRYLDGELMAEEYLFGPLFSLEVWVSKGQVHALGVTDRQLGPLPHFCEISYTFPVVLPEETRASMLHAVSRVVESLRLPAGLLHTEFVVTENGPKLVELNPRLGGGQLSHMMDDCLSVCTSELLVAAALGVDVALPRTNGRASSASTVYATAPGRLEAVTGLDLARQAPFVREVAELLRVGDVVLPPRDYRGAVCQVRATAPSATLAYNSAQTAHQLLSQSLRIAHE